MLLEICTEFDVIMARNSAKGFARELGFDGLDVAKIDVAVAELSNNLVQHAIGGKLIIVSRAGQGRVAFEAISVDSGPGIDNLSQALLLGYSSGGSLGVGLNSIGELMDEFWISSQPGASTLVIVRKWKK